MKSLLLALIILGSNLSHAGLVFIDQLGASEFIQNQNQGVLLLNGDITKHLMTLPRTGPVQCYSGAKPFCLLGQIFRDGTIVNSSDSLTSKVFLNEAVRRNMNLVNTDQPRNGLNRASTVPSQCSEKSKKLELRIEGSPAQSLYDFLGVSEVSKHFIFKFGRRGQLSCEKQDHYRIEDLDHRGVPIAGAIPTYQYLCTFVIDQISGQLDNPEDPCTIPGGSKTAGGK